MNDADIVEVSVHVAAPPATVFAYFTDPDRYVLWMGDRAELEPRPGGIYRVTMRDGVRASGEFLEVDAPHRVVFSWGWDHEHAVAPGSTRVEVTLTEEDGGTRVVLRHSGLPDIEQGPTTEWAGRCTSVGCRWRQRVEIPVRARTPERWFSSPCRDRTAPSMMSSAPIVVAAYAPTAIARRAGPVTASRARTRRRWRQRGWGVRAS